MFQLFQLMFDIITSVLSGFFKLLVDLVSLGVDSFSAKKGYNASFASEGTLLSRRNKGFALTGRKNISVKQSYMNALIVGQTGSGKSQVALLSSCFSTDGSFVIHDPSGEIFSATAGFFKMSGYKIQVLHFSNADISAGYNPITRANTSSEIQKLASLLVRATFSNGKGDPFWESSATAALAILISILKRQPEKFQNLHNLRHLLNHLGTTDDEANPVDDLFDRYADPVLLSEYRALINLDPKLLSSITATCKSALTIFADTSVARVTATDSIDFSEFRKHRTVLFIRNSIADQKYYSVLSNIFLEQLSAYILSRFPEKDEQNIFLLIDEFSSLRCNIFPLAFANFRKHRAGIMAVVQNVTQIANSFGKENAEAIISNCYSKLYFGGGLVNETRALEETLGKYTREGADGKKDILPLLSSDRIRMLPPNRALLICGPHAPILARVRPAYRSPRYRSYTALPAPILKGDCPDSVAMLPLDKDA